MFAASCYSVKYGFPRQTACLHTNCTLNLFALYTLYMTLSKQFRDGGSRLFVSSRSLMPARQI
eukprot:5174450-Pyramimonas_sp.AAC.1